MRLNTMGKLPFDVTARTEPGNTAVTLQLRIGPLQFSLSEAEAVGLAFRLSDAVEQRRRREQKMGLAR